MPAPSEDATGRRVVGPAWRGLHHWLKRYTFAPLWLPERWRHPAMGYLLGIALVAVAVGCDLLILHFLPDFGMPGLLVLLTILLMALGWGPGPSFVATLASVVLLDVFDIAPRMVIIRHLASLLVDDTILVLVGLIISAIAFEIQRARQRAEALRQLAEKAAERWRILQFISEAALTHRPLGELLQTLLERICAAMCIENCAILLLDEAGEALTIRAVCGLEADLAREARIPLGRGASGHVAVTGQTLVLGDLSAIETVYPYFRERFRSYVGSPLLVDGQILGVIHMTSALPNHFTEEDARLLELLASRLALVIDYARLDEAGRRSHADAEARARELEAIFEALSEGLMAFDARGYIVHVNTAARYFLGPGSDTLDFFNYSLADWGTLMMVRDEHGQVIPQDQLPVQRALRGEVLTGDQAQELILRKLTGEDSIISSSSAPIRDAEGRIVGAVSAFHDVTERRRLERRTLEALKGLLSLAQTLLQAPGEALLPEDQTLAGHSTAGRLAEMTAQILGCQRLGIFSFDAEADELTPVAVVGLAGVEELWQFKHFSLSNEFFARLCEGKPLVWDIKQSPLSEPPNPLGIPAILAVPMLLRKQLVGALFLDYGSIDHIYTSEERSLAEGSALLAALVLDRERLLREREEALANALALREANRQMDEFLGVAGHELRTPLTSVLLGLQLSLRRYQRLLREGADISVDLFQKLTFLLDQLFVTERQAKRLDRLVNDLLDVSRIQRGTLLMHPERADLAAIVAEAVNEQRQAAPDRQIELHLPPDTPVLLVMDPERIRQVVINYLTNALKYSAEDEPVAVGLEREAGAARGWVRDHGPGLPASEQALIWERFHRAPGIEVRSGSGVGLGLGLHISRTIIEAHRGEVGVQSTPGEGSTFWFTLPLAAAAQD